ncbi:MAG: hypothetical protein ACXADY_09955 [Candidatus Hodarchaeales archaeon]|jgi:hypothetical protein
MDSNIPHSQVLQDIRQKRRHYQIDDFVFEFLILWDFIHQQAPSLSLTDIKSFLESILHTFTLPFYQKFKSLSIIEKYEGWFEEYSSIIINTPKSGNILFPLRLVTYEVVSYQDNLLHFFLKKIQTGEIICTPDNLFFFLFPKLINNAIPLSEIDLIILKSYQPLTDNTSDFFKGPVHIVFLDSLHLPKKTIIKHRKKIKFFQIPIELIFLDMAQLGYETFLLSHFNPIPDYLKPYIKISVNLTISQFSLFHVPVTKPKIFNQINTDLEPIFFHKMEKRIQNWNLSGLGAGKDGWKLPPSFLYSDPLLQITTPSPTMDVSLIHDNNSFRRLTPADIKIFDFVTSKGTFGKKKYLSKAVNVSIPEINRRMEEYRDNNLIFRIIQFFNIGLDLTVSFFISCPTTYDIFWIPHFLSFPKVEIFFSIDKKTSVFFGHFKLPSKWIKDFISKVATLEKNFNDLKIYFTLKMPDIPKWSISLADTYDLETDKNY